MAKVVGNPYIAGPPIAGDVGFYGREDIFRFVRETFSSPAQNVIVLYGQRRIGKTSILYQLQKPSNLPTGFHPVYLDLEGLADQNLDKVLHRLAQEIAKSLNISIPLPPEFRIGDGDYFYDRFLPQVYEALKGDRLLLLFDEFEVSSEEPRSNGAIRTFFPYLQKKIMSEQQLAFIFAIGRRLDELSDEYRSTFKAALAKAVSFLREEDARRLITEPASDIGIEYDDKAVECIVSLTACHPYLTQLICYVLVNYLKERDKTLATANDVKAVIDSAIESGKGGLAWLWDGLPRAERFFLSAVAHVTDEGGMATQEEVRDILHRYGVQLLSPELTRAPDTLITKWGWLKPTKEGYKFVVELLRRWIIKEHSLEEAKRELELVSSRASLLYDVARSAHLTDNDLDAAAHYYREALAINPYHSGAQLGLAQVLFEQGEIREAITEYEKAYVLDKVSARDGLVEARLALAESLEREGEIAQAIREYENFILPIASDNENVRERAASIWGRQGDEYLQEGRFDEAAQTYNRAEEIQPGKKEELEQKRYQLEMAIGYANAMRAHKAKEWAVAEAEWSKLYNKDRDYRDKDGKGRKVAALLAEAIERHEIGARLILAESLEEKGETAQALQEYEGVLVTAPDDENVQEQVANFWIKQGDKYQREGRYEKVLEAYRRVREIQPAKKESIDQNWRGAMATGYVSAMQARKTRDWDIAEERWSKLYSEDRNYDKDGKDKKVAVRLAEAIEKHEAVPRPERRYLLLASGVIGALLVLSLYLGFYATGALWPLIVPPSSTPAALSAASSTVTEVLPTATPTMIVVVATPTPTPTPTPTFTPTPTSIPTPTPTFTPTPTPTFTPVPKPPLTLTPIPLGNVEVWDVDINPQNSQEIYAVVKGRGVYRTTDGGHRWKQTYEHDTVESLTIDLKDPSILYAVIWDGILKSTDGGATWNVVASGKDKLSKQSHVLAVARDDNRIVYAGTDGGVYRSSNGGRTWEARNKNMADTPIYSLVIGSNDGQLVYAAGKGCEIWKSTDGGSSQWERLSSEYLRKCIYALALHPRNSQWIYAGTDASILMLSTDGGRKWVLRNEGLKHPEFELKISALAIDPGNPDTIYAGTGFRSNYDGHGIYKSTDGGLSWKPINKGLPVDDMYLGGYYVQAIAIDPNDSETIYAGGFSGLYKSTDGGASWSQQ